MDDGALSEPALNRQVRLPHWPRTSYRREPRAVAWVATGSATHAHTLQQRVDRSWIRAPTQWCSLRARRASLDAIAGVARNGQLQLA